MSTHKHAIIIIKNDKNEYLQYYDNRWNSYLFLNCKLPEESNEETIINDIVNKLKLPQNSFECTYVMDKIHTKYSESAQKEKEYHHYFYRIHIEDIPNIMNEKTFSIDNIKYTWYSLKELEEDKRIQEVNSDIVNMVKSLEGKNN